MGGGGALAPADVVGAGARQHVADGRGGAGLGGVAACAGGGVAGPWQAGQARAGRGGAQQTARFPARAGRSLAEVLFSGCRLPGAAARICASLCAPLGMQYTTAGRPLRTWQREAAGWAGAGLGGVAALVSGSQASAGRGFAGAGCGAGLCRVDAGARVGVAHARGGLARAGGCARLASAEVDGGCGGGAGAAGRRGVEWRVQRWQRRGGRKFAVQAPICNLCAGQHIAKALV